MKKQNKKLFLRFLKNRGIDTMFKGLYRQYRFPNNPEDFEQFLNAVDSYYVIQEAFDFNRIKASSEFDGHYWSKLQKQWNILLTHNNLHPKEEPEEIVLPRVPVKNPDGSIHHSPSAEDIVPYDWSGLDLVPLSDKSKRQMPQPQPLEIRVATASGNVVVFNPHITGALIQFGLLTMDMQVDKRTNRLVFVFGTGLTYPLRNYSTGIMSITNKQVVQTLQKYLDIEFDKEKAYYIKINEKMWSKDHTRCAIVVTTSYTEKER